MYARGCSQCRTPVPCFLRRSTGLVQLFAGGQTGDDAERRRRREASRALLAQFERTVKPVRDLLAALRDRQPPDYGPLQVDTAAFVTQQAYSSEAMMWVNMTPVVAMMMVTSPLSCLHRHCTLICSILETNPLVDAGLGH